MIYFPLLSERDELLVSRQEPAGGHEKFAELRHDEVALRPVRYAPGDAPQPVEGARHKCRHRGILR